MAESLQEEEILGKAYDIRLIWRLLRYLVPYWRMTMFALAAALLYGALQIVPGYLLKVEVDHYLAPPNGQPFRSILARILNPNPMVGIPQIAIALYLPTAILGFLLEFSQSFAMQMAGQKVMYDLRGQIFFQLQRLPISFLDRNPVGRMVTRVTTDVDTLNDLFASGVVAIFGDFFTMLSLMVVMVELNWKLALLTFSVLPVILIIIAAFRGAVRESHRRIRVAIARINAFLQEHLAGISVLQLFTHEERSFDEFERINRVHMEAYKRSILAYGLFYPAVEVVGVIAVGIILYMGGSTALHGSFTVGTVIAFIQYLQRLFRSIQDLSDKYNLVQSAMASSERIFKLLDNPATIEDPSLPKRLDHPRGRVEFQQVGFAYTDDRKVLENISFAIEPGETVAVVGHTGAGKTTLTNLLLRFYDVQEGRVTFDGIDIREMSLSDLRKNIGVVLQDPFLFSGTIAGNIRLGSGISDEQVRTAARQVNLLEFVEDLPQGFDEVVKERGATLSVGQKQLLTFARALAHNPRVLILDEATSSVDPKTERMLREGMQRLIQNRTSIVIAHRLSTIQNASKIVVMHKGRVCEVGTHQELLLRQGIYFKLYQLQYKDQECKRTVWAVSTDPQ